MDKMEIFISLVLPYILVLVRLLDLVTLSVLMPYVYIYPWFVSTNITRIETCCQVEFNIKGYLFNNYEFSTWNKTKCNKKPCDSFSTDVMDSFVGQMNNTTKLEEDIISAGSTILVFVRASHSMIIIRIVIRIILLPLIENHGKLDNSKPYVLLMLISPMLTILAATGVGVYSTFYKNLIGFSYSDLSNGWNCSVAACVVAMIFDLEHIIVTFVAYIKHRKRSTSITSKRSWIVVKKGDRNTVLDTPMTYVASEITDIHQHNEVDLDINERSIDERKHRFQKIIDNMWNRRLVGKGADAKNLSHANIKVDKVEPGHNDNGVIVGKFIGFRSVFHERKKRCGQLQYLNDKPILTSKLINTVRNSCTMSKGKLNTCLNEFFLFHGTTESNAENILTYGFDITKVKRPFLGKGMYFAESPVKADQYTDASATKIGCLLLCRVILGNFIVRTTSPGNELSKWTHLPCSRCLKEDCTKHAQDERFDSLIYDNPRGLFREFVIFNADQILVESSIKYYRITHTRL